MKKSAEYAKNNNIELIYDIKFKKKEDESLINELRSIVEVDTVNLVSSNTDTMG